MNRRPLPFLLSLSFFYAEGPPGVVEDEDVAVVAELDVVAGTVVVVETVVAAVSAAVVGTN